MNKNLASAPHRTDKNEYLEFLQKKSEELRVTNSSEDVDGLISGLVGSGYIPSDFEMPEVY